MTLYRCDNCEKEILTEQAANIEIQMPDAHCDMVANFHLCQKCAKDLFAQYNETRARRRKCLEK